jgi:hypothetical protein
MAREKHYFGVYDPEYNTAKTPGKPYRAGGWKHSEASLDRLRNISPETRQKLYDANPGTKVMVTDLETNTTTPYAAIRTAARALEMDKRYIEHYIYLNQTEPVFDRYTFELIPDKNSNTANRDRVQKTAKRVEVTDLKTKKAKYVNIYPSISAAARAMGYRQPSVSLYLKDKRPGPYQGRYRIKVID